MDDLHARFRRLDRVATPNLWNEAVDRADALARARRPWFSPALALMAATLLMATLAGTVAVGAWLDQQRGPESTIRTYDNGLIVMPDDCDGIVAYDPNSLEEQQLVAPSADCEFGLGTWASLAWSRDGTRLAFARFEKGMDDGPHPWIYETATGNARQVGVCPGGCGWETFVISPDGSLMGFVSWQDTGTSELVVLEVESGDAHEVPLPGTPGPPAFSPDGRRIAFPVVGGRSGVYVVDVGGLPDGDVGTPWMLHGPVEAHDLAWSPDGEWIAMTQSGGFGNLDAEDRATGNPLLTASRTGIVIVNVDGTDVRTVTMLPEQWHWALPTWSADSASIAYVTNEAAEGEERPELVLWTVEIGGEPRRIHDVECCIEGLTGPAWSPDGEWIAFGFARPGYTEIETHLLRPDGTDLRLLSNDVLGEPVWQPIPRE